VSSPRLAADVLATLTRVEAVLKPYAASPVHPFADRIGELKIGYSRVAGALSDLRRLGAGEFGDPQLFEQCYAALSEAMMLTAHATRENGHGLPEWYRTGEGFAAHVELMSTLGAVMAERDARRAALPARPRPARR
jgi:hypothetical protein